MSKDNFNAPVGASSSWPRSLQSFSKLFLHSFSACAPYLLVFLAAVLPRVFLGFFYPYDGLDWPIVYQTVADNIYRNHCVSQSIPQTASCLPHWGGNQFPGFPAFVALAWMVSGKSNFAVLFWQSILTSAAICWLMHAIRELTHSMRTGIAVGLVLALSPVTIGWARSLNTEALAIASTIWVLAELLLSLARARLRIWPLGIALACAAFIRYDNASLCFLVIICAFATHRPAQAIRRGVAVALIFAAPLLAWTARSVAKGLPPVPTVNIVASINRDGMAIFPEGIKKYALTWFETATDQRTFTMPAYNGAYQEMRVPDGVFDSESERRQVHSLLSRLSRLHDRPIPKDINDAFGALAAQRYAANPLRQIIWLPLARTKALWFNPFYSWGMPIGFDKASIAIPIEHQLRAGGSAALIQVVIENPAFAIGKAIVNGYFFVLLVAFGAILFVLPRVAPPSQLRVAFGLALTLALARTILLISMGQLETRYIAECVPAIEIAVVLAWFDFRRRAARSSDERMSAAVGAR